MELTVTVRRKNGEVVNEFETNCLALAATVSDSTCRMLCIERASKREWIGILEGLDFLREKIFESAPELRLLSMFEHIGSEGREA